MDRLDRARWHRLQHFGSAAYSLDTALWFRLKRVAGETGSVRAHRQPDGTVGTCPAQVMWGKAHQPAVGGSLFHDGPDHLRRETVSPHSSRFVDGSKERT